MSSTYRSRRAIWRCMGTQENSSKGQIKYNTEVPKLPCISMCKEAFVKGQVQKICFMFEKTWGARIMKWWDLGSLSILLLSLIEKEHEINGNTFLSSIEGIGFPLYNTEKCSIRTSVLLCIYNRVPVYRLYRLSQLKNLYYQE